MSVHLYSLACGHGYFFFGPADVGVPEGLVVAFPAVDLVALPDFEGVLEVVVVFDVLIGGGGLGLADDTVDIEPDGRTDVGSFLDFAVGAGGRLDW